MKNRKVNEKMTKLFSMLLIVLVTGVMMSCGSDDSNDDVNGKETELVSQLQGTWKFYSGIENIMGMTITMDRSTLDQMKAMMEQSNNMRIEIWDETLRFSGNQLNGVPYKLNEDKLLLEGMELFEGISINVKSVTSSTLILHEVIQFEGTSLTADMEYHKQ